MPYKRMPRLPSREPFGRRLASIRKEAGYSQRALAKALGISHRMVAYYEGQTEHPPAALLPDLARLFGITADELLGITRPRAAKPGPKSKLERQLDAIKTLPRSQQQFVRKFLDQVLGDTG